MLKNCVPLHEESRALYKMRAHSQESVVGTKGWIGSRFLPLPIVAKTAASSPVVESGGLGSAASF